jgi:DNA-binding transcriptional MerR regulator
MNGLTVGRVAAAAGVSAGTVRHYERIGVLPKAGRTAAGYRVYPPGAVHRVRLVQRAPQFGFTLRELAGYLRVRDSGGTPCRQVRAAGERILEAIDRELADLRRTRRRMARTLSDWDARLDGSAGREPARLLESLSDAWPRPAPGRPSRPPRGRAR